MSRRYDLTKVRAQAALVGARAALDTFAAILAEADFDPDDQVFSVNDVLVLVLRAKANLNESDLLALMTEPS